MAETSIAAARRRAREKREREEAENKPAPPPPPPEKEKGFFDDFFGRGDAVDDAVEEAERGKRRTNQSTDSNN